MQQKLSDLYNQALLLGDQLLNVILILWVLGIGAQLIVQHRLTKEILFWPMTLIAKIILGIVSLFSGGERKRR